MSTTPLIGAALFAQSGGPTAVINASAYGVIRAAQESADITHIYAAANGIVGALADKLYDIGAEDPAELALLAGTPSSAFGSCRYKLKPPETDDTDYQKLLALFKKRDIRYFFYNGGNDSMDTCDKISRFFASSGYECRVIGVPKTIDNDLVGTDHAPGYGSAAKYIATAVAEVSLDNAVYDTPSVTVMEMMGRHAGWLTGAAALAGVADLIYLPEVAFDLDAFAASVKKVYDTKGKVLVCVSEGIQYADGTFVADAPISSGDGFAHAQLGGLAARLADVVKQRLGVKTRPIELSLLQRCAAHCASQTDVDEAIAVGEFAVKIALGGATGQMATIQRAENAPYRAEYVAKPVSDAANAESKVPREWITPDGTGVTQAFIDYALPLIQGDFKQHTENGLPRFARLKLVRA
ncbi:MAG: 6-phosphofructokinase [Oscillospiraceae bacterium]|jgi:6-phosphofructokinase 1|nr:6-phosphofructokinase [Oscillospiraceae bacterium]